MSEQIITAKEEDDKLILNYHQDVEPNLKDAADSRRFDAEHRTRFGRRAEFRRTMTIPFTVMMQVAEKLGIQASDMFGREQQSRIAKELKGSDFSLFRTTVDKGI